MSDTPFLYDDEAVPFDETDWNRLLAVTRLRHPRLIQAYQAAEQFSASMKTLERTAGQALECLEELGQALMDMAKDET